LLAVQGNLSPASYIYGGFCKLTGGFAFFTWFSGEHEGDYVVTLGGYHPAYNRPPHYPVVPRLGMTFSLGPFQVVGQAYFALTPLMMMAGQSMSATWSSGPVSAWLDAGFDFLIAWAPFHYEADAYINVGCTVDLGLFTIHAHIGADLTVWGPPFGGTAEVDLDVVSFTISFGAGRTPPSPIGWATFRDNFLPKDSGAPEHAFRMFGGRLAAAAADAATNIIKASVPSGLLQSAVLGVDWILSPDDFAIVTNSTIPANNGEWVITPSTNVMVIPNDLSKYDNIANAPYWNTPEGPFSATNAWNPELDIRPMNLTNVQSYHTVELRMRDANDQYSIPVTWVSVQPQIMHSSAALWKAASPQPSPNDPPMQPGTMTGFQISPIPRNPSQVSNIPLLTLIFQLGNDTGFVFRQKAVDARYTVQSSFDAQHDLQIQVSGAHTASIKNQNYLLGALTDTWVASQRNAILDDLNANGFSTFASTDVNPTILATQTALVDWPMVQMIGTV
jgi:hypothetical protein